MGNSSFQFLTSKQNPETRSRHKKETLWQIYLPIVLGGVLVLVGVGFPVAALTRGQTVGVWAEIATIWLLLPAMILALIIFIALAGMIYGLVRLYQVVPGVSFRVLKILRRIKVQLRVAADKSVAPVLRWKSMIAALKAIRKGVFQTS